MGVNQATSAVEDNPRLALIGRLHTALSQAHPMDGQVCLDVADVLALAQLLVSSRLRCGLDQPSAANGMTRVHPSRLEIALKQLRGA